MRVSTTFLQRNIKEVLDIVRIKNEDVILTNYGKPVAVILSLDRYEKIRQPNLDRSDKKSKDNAWHNMRNILK